METRETYLKKIKEILVRNVDVSPETEVTEDFNFKDEGLDSLCLYDLTIELEKIYDIQIEEIEIEAIRTVSDIINLIEEKI